MLFIGVDAQSARGMRLHSRRFAAEFCNPVALRVRRALTKDRTVNQTHITVNSETVAARRWSWRWSDRKCLTRSDAPTTLNTAKISPVICNQSA